MSSKQMGQTMLSAAERLRVQAALQQDHALWEHAPAKQTGSTRAVAVIKHLFAQIRDDYGVDMATMVSELACEQLRQERFYLTLAEKYREKAAEQQQARARIEESRPAGSTGYVITSDYAPEIAAATRTAEQAGLEAVTLRACARELARIRSETHDQSSE